MFQSSCSLLFAARERYRSDMRRLKVEVEAPFGRPDNLELAQVVNRQMAIDSGLSSRSLNPVNLHDYKLGMSISRTSRNIFTPDDFPRNIQILLATRRLSATFRNTP